MHFLRLLFTKHNLANVEFSLELPKYYIYPFIFLLLCVAYLLLKVFLQFLKKVQTLVCPSIHMQM